jgi:ferredoxin-thioredoxin reductase catalytic subunit
VGPIRGLWRLLDGKVESGLMSDSELRGGSPCPCRLRTDRLAPVDMFEMCTDTYGIYGVL